MKDFMRLRVISPEMVLLDVDHLRKVRIPLVGDTSIGIRPGHHPLIAETTKGTIHYESEHQKIEIDLQAGVLNVKENILTIFTAGKVSEELEEVTDNPDATYDRLMNTLIARLYTNEDNHENQEQPED